MTLRHSQIVMTQKRRQKKSNPSQTCLTIGLLMGAPPHLAILLGAGPIKMAAWGTYSPTGHLVHRSPVISHRSSSHWSTSHWSTSHRSASHRSISHRATNHRSSSHWSSSHQSTSHRSTSHRLSSHWSTSHGHPVTD